MSSSASDPGKGATSLNGRIEALERQTAALSAALVQAQRVRLWITLALVAFIGLTITIFYRRAEQLNSEENRNLLAALAQKSVDDHADDFMKQLETLARAVSPVVTDAFYEQAKRDLPKYLQASERERDQLVRNLQEHLQTTLGARFDKSLVRHEELIKQEFPTADNEEIRKRMMKNVEAALQTISQKYYGKELGNQMEALYGTWDQFPPAPAPAKGEAALIDQLIGMLLELLTVKLKSTEIAAAE
ncbi:MAG TPA: hypothetical protein VND64_32435 [Pirellulales bacterium]|nr:hypothetical protein [Pirellulales bacterium]